MMPLLIMGLVAELLTFFVLWSEGLLIAFAGATVAGVLAMVGTGIVLSLRRKEPTSGRKEPTSVNKISD
jgi:hypothetical protein